MWYDKQGRLISMDKANKLLGEYGYRSVGYDKLPNGFAVSTVWLGLDHNYARVGKPVIFETMVFGPDGDSTDCVRYSTLEEAARGHTRVLEQTKKIASASDKASELPKLRRPRIIE